MRNLGVAKGCAIGIVCLFLASMGLIPAKADGNSDGDYDSIPLEKLVYPIKGSKIIIGDSGTQPLSAPPPQSSIYWPQFHYDQYKSGHMNRGTIAFNWDYKWSPTVSSPIHSSVVVSPVSGELIYGAENGCFYRYNKWSTCYPGWKARSTPAVDASETYVFFAWEYPSPNSCFERHFFSNGAYSWGVCHPEGYIRGPITILSSSPAIIYYIVDYPTSSISTIFAWSNTVPNMSLKWWRTFSSAGGDPLAASPAVTGGTSNDIVLFGAKDGKVYCLKGDTGAVLTSFNTNSPIYVSPSFDVTNRYLFVINSAGNLYKFTVSYGSGSCTLTKPSGWPISVSTGSGNVYSAPAISPFSDYGYRVVLTLYKSSAQQGSMKIIDGNTATVIFTKSWGEHFSAGSQIFMSSPAVTKTHVFFLEEFGSSNYADLAQFTLNGNAIYHDQSTYKLGIWADSSPALYYNKDTNKVWAYIGGDDGYIHAYSE